MAVNRYPGICWKCEKQVPAGGGDFELVGSLPKDVKPKYTGKNYKGTL